MLYLSNDIMLAHKSLMVNNNHNLPEFFLSVQLYHTVHPPYITMILTV